MRNRETVLIGILTVMCGVTAVSAQVPSGDQSCITTFNKGVAAVAKAQGKLVAKCVRDFASGKLVSITPEQCLVADLFGRLQGTINKAASADHVEVRREHAVRHDGRADRRRDRRGHRDRPDARRDRREPRHRPRCQPPPARAASRAVAAALLKCTDTPAQAST